jgi:hypothetical protein
MKNVKIKEEVKEVKVVEKKVVKKAKKESALATFMEDRNAKRKAASLKPAYTEEEINNCK